MRPNYYIIVLINLVFFVLALLSSIIGALLPDMITGFNLDLQAASFLPFCFYIAYGVISIPTGIFVERIGDKKVLLYAFAISLLGSLLFALFPYYKMGVFSLFLVGSAMAMLQVSVNPLLRTASGPKRFAFYATVTQLIYGLGAFLSPHIYRVLMGLLPSNTTTTPSPFLSLLAPNGKQWVMTYWIFSLVTFCMLVIIFISRFPKVVRNNEEQAGSWATHLGLLKQRKVLLFFIAIFMYVACEQGNSNWISQFLYTYHHYPPQTVGANTLSWYWILLALGCIPGMIILKYVDSRHMLLVCSTGALICFLFAITGSGPVSLVAFPLVGLMQSIMWPVIISLALNSVRSHHGSFSGILITGIIGGAIAPLVIGTIGDWLSLRVGMCTLLLPYLYVISVGIWAKPLPIDEHMERPLSNTCVATAAAGQEVT